MKRKWVIAILIVVLVLISYTAGVRQGQYGNWVDAAEPPMPEITIDGQDIRVYRGTYSWCEKPSFLGIGNCVVADSIGAEEFYKQEKVIPTAIQPQSKINIEFGREFTARPSLMEMNLTNTNKDYKGDPYYIPSEKGLYIYEIATRWRNEQGKSAYFFFVEVK